MAMKHHRLNTRYVLTCILCTLIIAILPIPSWGQNYVSTSAANDYIGIYKKYLSNLKNTRCNMYPSCSTYGMMCFASHSFPVAIIKTADRIIRCGHDLAVYPVSYNYGFSTAVDYPKGHKIPENVIYQKPSFISGELSGIKDSLSYGTIKFVSKLINDQNFASALLEIDRALYLNPNLFLNHPTIYVNKLKCYTGLKEYEKGIMQYETIFPDSVKNDYKVLCTIAHMYGLINNDDAAISKYEQAIKYLPKSNIISPYGELAILYASRGDWNNAEEAFHKKFLIDQNDAAFNSSIQILNHMKNHKSKNPTVAMVMSIVPGMGYLYTKQPQNALTALLINGALAYAGYTSFKCKNYGLGFIIGTLNLSFYFGNLYGSRNSALRYNSSQKDNSLKILREINPYTN